MGYLRDLCEVDNAVLLVIDVQGKLFDMAFNSAQLKPLVAKMMRVADLFGVPVVVTEQYPRGLGHTAPEIMQIYEGLETEKHLLEKTAFGCCGEQGFDNLLAGVARGVMSRRSIKCDGDSNDTKRPVDVVVAGIETQVCVQQTVLELLKEAGYRVVVLQDVTGSRVEAYHHIALERFRQCGAVISCYESVSFEWARSKDHPLFKQMSAIVKE